MRRVLVVDSEEQVRGIATKFLERYGYQVDVATDGADAIHRLTGERYDAVVLDVIMPRIDGRGVLVHLARTNPTMIGRTVLIARAAREAVEAQLDEVCRVLVKPFGVRQLLDAIDECMAA